MVNKVNLGRWRKHLTRAAARGITLARYARESGLSKHTLYAASQQQRAEQGRERGEAKLALTRKGKTARSAFIAVRLRETVGTPEHRGGSGAAMLQARLPNGVQIGIEVIGIEADAALPSRGTPGASAQAPWAQVLRVLAGLPCSR